MLLQVDPLDGDWLCTPVNFCYISFLFKPSFYVKVDDEGEKNGKIMATYFVACQLLIWQQTATLTACANFPLGVVSVCQCVGERLTKKLKNLPRLRLSCK